MGQRWGASEERMWCGCGEARGGEAVAAASRMGGPTVTCGG